MLKKEVKKNKNIVNTKRSLLNFSMEIAKLFKNIPIYYHSVPDYRLRIYPKELLFSRTTGYFKYMVTDYDEIELTYEGFYIMLLAFFKHNNNLVIQLKNLFKNNINDFSVLKNFFLDNHQYVDLSINFIYFSLLFKEIFYMVENNNYKTSFMIEIDQKSSCAVILACLSKNQELAKYANCVGGEYDIYFKLKNSFVTWLKINVPLFFQNVKNKIVKYNLQILNEKQTEFKKKEFKEYLFSNDVDNIDLEGFYRIVLNDKSFTKKTFMT
jgi:hypothetical protein